MSSATTSYLLSTSHFNVIEKLHVNLHDLAANVINYCKNKEFRPATLIHLMQRIDYYSLEIGNEIAFLNEIEEGAKDPLTHLLTRRLFNKIMMNTLDISKATGRGFALMMCDLDHFKSINDTYGHSVGDIVLKHFSGILEQNLRKSDYIFRFGGEEFMILLPTTDKKDALFLAQKVCDATAAREVIVENLASVYGVSEHSQFSSIIPYPSLKIPSTDTLHTSTKNSILPKSKGETASSETPFYPRSFSNSAAGTGGLLKYP
jgi:diguanylate cyclase (GGDEF)-like protein